MNIVDNRRCRLLRLDQLVPGDVFQLSYSPCTYMIIRKDTMPIQSSFESDDHHGTVFAVDLTDGGIDWFVSNKMVERVGANLSLVSLDAGQVGEEP